MKTLKYFSIYCAIFLVPFYFFRFSIFGLKTNIFEIFVLMAFLASLPLIIKEQKFKIGAEARDWFLPLLFLVTSLISVFFADDKAKALGIFKGWFLAPILFAWLIKKSFNKKTIYFLTIPLYISLSVVSIWAISQKMGFVTNLFYQIGDNSFSVYLKEGRIFGPFESPNYLAMFLASAFFLALPIVEQTKHKWLKVMVLASLLLPMTALYFSGSRAGIVSFVICLLVFLNYRFVNLQKSQDRRPFFTGLFIALFVVINSGYLFFATNYYKASSGGDMARTDIYKNSILLLKNNSVSGIGLGSFQGGISKFTEGNNVFQEFALPYALHPHNLLLAVWINLGIFGLTVFVLILIDFLKNTFSSDSKIRAAILAAMAAIVIHGLFDTTYFKNDLSVIFWLIFAYSIIISRKDEIKTSN